MGLKMGSVIVEKYNPEWKNMYLAEEKILLKLFGSTALTIEHVGSTSIEGLSAKPIIDVAVGVENLEDFKLVMDNFLEEDGYSIKDDSVNGEILVRKGSEEDRTHFIHVMELNGDRYVETIVFRDHMRNNKDDVKAYEDLKLDLAQKYPEERKKYTAEKNEFIKNILEKAAK